MIIRKLNDGTEILYSDGWGVFITEEGIMWWFKHNQEVKK